MSRPSSDPTRERPSFGALAGMVSCLALSCLTLSCAGPESPDPGLDPEALPPDAYPYDHGHRSTGGPDPSFRALPGAAVGRVRQALRAEGEVVVIEGDDRFLTTAGPGAYGLTQDNLVAIAREVLTQYPDVFDTIMVHLSFVDQANPGAYYQGIANDVAGLGRDVFNGRAGWGLPAQGGRLSGFVNMNSLEVFGGLEQAGIERSGFHAVIAQELSHRWLFFMKFKGPNGMDSDRLLGRDAAHWSRLAQASGSVQDGNRWRALDDSTFLMEGSDDNFAPLDLYGMGIYGKGQVEPFFFIDEASLDGMPLTSTSRIPRGSRVTGRKVDVTIDQVIAALGPRNPPVGTEDPYYRVAVVLLTAPGQTEAEVAPFLRATQKVQETFPLTYKAWTKGAGAMCMKVTERCPEPRIGLDRARLQDDADGAVGPGDTAQLAIRLRNEGLGTAEGVQVFVRSLTPGISVATGTVTAPAIAEGAATDLGMPVTFSVATSVPCASVATLEVTSTTQEGPKFRARFELPIGGKRLRLDDVEDPVGWRVDPEKRDTATSGAWSLGAPEFISVLGVLTQPAEDHSPGTGKLAFMTGPRKGASFSANDLDGGSSTLETPIFALEGTVSPSLVFYLWFVARDFVAMGGPGPVPEASLEIQASSDGGATYVPISTWTEETPRWTRVVIPLDGKVPLTNRTRFRFVAKDGSTRGVTEVGVDDLELTDVLPACVPAKPNPNPDENKSGCAVTGGGPELAAVLLLLARRRRRPRGLPA